MAIQLAFLRAINLGGRRTFGPAEIQSAVERAGGTDVATHINTGNVRFATRMRSRQRIEAHLERAFAADRGFAVPTIVFAAAEFAGVVAEAEALAAEHSPDLRHQVWLLKDQPDQATRKVVEALSGRGHQAIVRGRACHLLLAPTAPGVTDPLRTERHLGVATNRKMSVLRAIAEKWC